MFNGSSSVSRDGRHLLGYLDLDLDCMSQSLSFPRMFLDLPGCHFNSMFLSNAEANSSLEHDAATTTFY